MAQRNRHNPREELKRLLLAEADLHRAVLQTEWQRARSSWSWILTGADWSRWLARLPHRWAWFGAAAGWLATRRWREFRVWIPALFVLWRWWRRYGSRMLRSGG